MQLDQSEATGKDGSLAACEAEGRREIDKQAGQAGKQAGVQVGMQRSWCTGKNVALVSALKKTWR